MSNDERYNGWANRETWAVALHINNDQGWQESVHEALRADVTADPDDFWNLITDQHAAHAHAGEIIREWVEGWLSETYTDREWYNRVSDIGSLWRVDWTELGAAFLEDIAEGDA